MLLLRLKASRHLAESHLAESHLAEIHLAESHLAESHLVDPVYALKGQTQPIFILQLRFQRSSLSASVYPSHIVKASLTEKDR